MLTHVVNFTVLVVTAIPMVGCGSRGADIRPSETAASDERDSFDRPAELVGTWQWQWSTGQKIILHADGRAERIEGQNDHRHRNGTWHVRDDGVLEVTMTMEFRVDDDVETDDRLKNIALMDIETIPTDHDFPWVKMDSDASPTRSERAHE